MEWTECIRKTIQCLEQRLLDTEEELDVSGEVGVSTFYLQKGFRFMTGYTIAEYVRCRRLYLAALEVIADKEKVIDIALKYGYDTPESFTKAFSRFHGVSPMQLKKEPSRLHVFLPLKIKIEVQGGNDMDYVVEREESFRVVGFEREFSLDTSHADIPRFWEEIRAKYMDRLMRGEKPSTDIERTVWDCGVGMYGVCIDDREEDGVFRYLIAGVYKGGEVPEGMTVYEVPGLTWAKFTCMGPLPGSLQSVNTKIYQEWLPGNPAYEIARSINLEWYSEGDMDAIDYESAIWIPVVCKNVH